MMTPARIRRSFVPFLICILCSYPSLATAGQDALLPCGFNLHGGDVGYDLTRAAAAFQVIADLGGELVRTDFSWNRVEPEMDVWDQGYMQFFRDYTALASEYGISVICIFSHPPDWAMELYQGLERDEFFDQYEGYCREIATNMGDLLFLYQIWNEANHPLVDPIAREDDWRVYLAGDRGVRLGGDPDEYLCMVNILCNTLFWVEDLEYYFGKMNAEEPSHTVRLIGIDHYPGTWTLTGYDDWSPLEALMDMISDPANACYGREGAIMETGYSSWGVLVHTERSQEDWVNISIPAAAREIRRFNPFHPNKIRFGIWYELYDGDSDSYPFDIEAHFGILHTDGSPKLAYDDLERLLRR